MQSLALGWHKISQFRHVKFEQLLPFSYGSPSIFREQNNAEQ